MELRDFFWLLGAVVTVVTAAAIARYQVAEHHAKLMHHATSIEDHSSRLSLLEQKQDWQSQQIAGLVQDLREVVASLQRLAVDLAAMTGKKG